MSIVEEVRGLERRVTERLAELEPLVAEYEELRALAQQLGFSYDGAAQEAAPPRRRASTGAKRTRRKTKRAPRATVSSVERQAQIAAIVAERPGVTVAEVAKELGVDATSLYRVVRRLEQRGEIRKDGRALHPVG